MPAAEVKANPMPGYLWAVELLLCSAVAASLCYTVQNAFNIDATVHSNLLLTAGVSLVLQALAIFAEFKPKGKVPARVLWLALALVSCVLSVALSQQANPIADVEQNMFVATLVFFVVNAVVCGMTRTRLLCVVLFAAGAFTAAFIQYLYVTDALLAAILVMVAAAMLIAFRSYSETATLAADTSRSLLGKASAIGVGLPVLACALSSLVVLCLIMPLNPPHVVVKIFNEYVSYQEVEVYTGVESSEDASKTITSSNVDETLPARTTIDKQLADEATVTVEGNNGAQSQQNDNDINDYSDVDLGAVAGAAQSWALNMPIPWPLLIALVVLALVLLATVPRAVVHRVRFGRIASKTPQEQVRLLYAFFLSRFKMLGFEKPRELSPVEFANMYRERLAPFVGAQGACTFDHLTALLVRQGYGGAPPSAGDLECMRWLYWDFYSKCRGKLGVFKYLFKYPLL